MRWTIGRRGDLWPNNLNEFARWPVSSMAWSLAGLATATEKNDQGERVPHFDLQGDNLPMDALIEAGADFMAEVEGGPRATRTGRAWRRCCLRFRWTNP